MCYVSPSRGTPIGFRRSAVGRLVAFNYKDSIIIFDGNLNYSGRADMIKQRGRDARTLKPSIKRTRYSFRQGTFGNPIRPDSSTSPLIGYAQYDKSDPRRYPPNGYKIILLLRFIAFGSDIDRPTLIRPTP